MKQIFVWILFIMLYSLIFFLSLLFTFSNLIDARLLFIPYSIIGMFFLLIATIHLYLQQKRTDEK